MKSRKKSGKINKAEEKQQLKENELVMYELTLGNVNK